MRIIIDTREKPTATKLIEAEFKRHGISFIRSKLPYGDYQSPDNPNVIIDRKQNLLELCANVSTVPKKDENGRIKKDSDGQAMTDLKRFTAELKGAKDFGYQLIILCEHGQGITCIEDVQSWSNPRLKKSPLAMSGPRLYVILNRLMITYGFKIVFCDKKDTGKEIIRLLGE